MTHPATEFTLGESALYLPLLTALWELAQEEGTALAAVDGRCCSGKTTFAALAASLLPCAVVHMDDFYLPPEDRPSGWQHCPGGNMDLVRLRREVLEPVRAGREVRCRPYDCKARALGPPLVIPPAPLVLVEGSYALHPDLADLYQHAIFLTCSPSVQLRRLRAREGDRVDPFLHTWLPLEEQYIALCHPQSRADLAADTSHL